MATKNGNETKAYYGTAGTAANTELTGILEDSMPNSSIEADVTTKGATFKLTDVVLHDATISFKLLWDQANAGHVAIKTAYEGKSALSMIWMDGPKNVNTSYGIGGDFKVTQFERGAPIEGKLTYDCTVKPTPSSANAVAWMTGS